MTDAERIKLIASIYSYNGKSPGFESLKYIEYEQCISYLKQFKLRNFIEIGSAWGASFHLWSTYVTGKKISVDAPTEFYPYLTKSDVEERENIWNSNFSDVYSIYGNSHDESTVSAVQKILDKELVDFLYIDASHEYYDVKTDFENYKHFVKPGGFIGFHDVLAVHVPDVVRFWNELKAIYKNTIEFGIPGSDGIGLIQLEATI